MANVCNANALWVFRLQLPLSEPISMRRSNKHIFVGLIFGVHSIQFISKNLWKKVRSATVYSRCAVLWQRVNQIRKPTTNKIIDTYTHFSKGNRKRTTTKTCFNLCSSGFKLHVPSMQRHSTSSPSSVHANVNCIDEHGSIDRERKNEKKTKRHATNLNVDFLFHSLSFVCMLRL